VALEEQAIREVGGCIKFAGDVVFSSSSLLNCHFNIYPKETEHFLRSFSSRYTSEDVIRSLERARQLRVLVLGEAIVDEYQCCETLSKTGKEPVLAARHISSERFAGGSLAVANHVTAVCDRVSVLTLLATVDSHEQFIREHLHPSVEKIFLYIENGPTIVKRRFLESYPLQKLFEIYVMAVLDGLGSQSAAICEKLDALLPEYDVVVVADYGHGTISPEVAHILSTKARFLAINTQVNAGNQGFNTVSTAAPTSSLFRKRKSAGRSEDHRSRRPAGRRSSRFPLERWEVELLCHTALEAAAGAHEFEGALEPEADAILTVASHT
jgi:hypothetical protein